MIEHMADVIWSLFCSELYEYIDVWTKVCAPELPKRVKVPETV